MTFHSVRFPTNISLGAVVTQERRTEIITLGSGYEERNSRWADSRRSYNAGYGVQTLDDLYQVLDFFEQQRGKLYGFLWQDPLEHKSCLPSQNPASNDQILGVGDGLRTDFQLLKAYGQNYSVWRREITKPVAGSVIIAVNGVIMQEGTHYTIDYPSGVVRFALSAIPSTSHTVTAGFLFDVAVRFDTDRLEVNMAHFSAGQIPDIPLIEIRV